MIRLFHWVLLLLAGSYVAYAAHPRGERVSFSLSRLRRGTEQDFWAMPSINYNSGTMEGVPIMDIPVNDMPLDSDHALDRIQVVSSALRILPRNKARGKREVLWSDRTEGNSMRSLRKSLRRKRETVQSWRRPRQHQFVTNKADRLPPPPIVRVYPPVDRSERIYDRGLRKSQRRIIYYADLPEIVRPPVQWYNTRGDYYNNPRQAYPSPSAYPSFSSSHTIPSSSYPSPSAISSSYPSTLSSSSYPSPSTISSSSYPSPTSFSSSPFPSPSENEITRVQSNIIDVSNNPRYSGYTSTPKFTIIDVEPFNYPSYYRRPPTRYEPYPSTQYTSNRYYNDIRTPPYRDHSNYPGQNFQPDSSLEPVKLQIPTTDHPSGSNSTELPANTTRFLPDIPVSLRSLSKFTT